jgi:hypothetical protein
VASEAETAEARLHQAVAMGYRNADAYCNADALDPLRDREDFRLLLMVLAFPAGPFAKDTDADRSSRSALRPTVTNDTPAAFVFGLGQSGWSPLKNVPSALSASEGQRALFTSVTDS